MKNGKNPTKRQKIYIQSQGLNPDNWLIYKIANGEIHLIHRYTFATRVIPYL